MQSRIRLIPANSRKEPLNSTTALKGSASQTYITYRKMYLEKSILSKLVLWL
jgi:hypothetical protein